MKSQQTLSKIMRILNLNEDEQNQVNAAQQTLENGTVIEAEAFEAGNEVFIVSGEDRVALPVGEYKMADGQILVVSQEGIIGEIKPAAAPAAPAPQEVAANEDEQKEEELNYVTKEELAEVVTEIKSMIEEMMDEKAEEEKKEELSKKKKLSRKPARKPMKHNPETKAKPQVNLHQNNKRQSTLDRVMSKIAQ